MTPNAEFKCFQTSGRSRITRLAAENTWLRHSLMEMEARVAAMATQLTELEARARSIHKTLTGQPAKPEPKTRSKQ